MTTYAQEDITYGGFVDLVPVEVTAAFGMGPDEQASGREILEAYLQTIEIDRHGDFWAVKGKDRQGLEKVWGIEIVMTQDKLIDALSNVGQYVVFDGHSNYGLGPEFPNFDANGGIIRPTKIEDYTNFGVGYTSIEMDLRKKPNGGGDLEVLDNQIRNAPINYAPPPLTVERFPNIDDVEVGQAFIKQGQGFDTWHYWEDNETSMLMIDAPKTDLPITLRYKTFFYNACWSGADYIENFRHGEYVYTTDSCFVSEATKVFVQGIVEGKTTEQIILLLNQDGVGAEVADPNNPVYEIKSF